MYKGLKGCDDYKTAAQIIQNGGYATAADYASKLCEVIEKWGLTQYDTQNKKQEKIVSTVRIFYAKLKTLMNIREGNSISAAKITTYKKDTVVEVTKVCDNGWFLIKCAESATGFGYVSNEDGQYAYTGKDIYTVKRGDTLWSIAKAYYGDPKRNTKIKSANGLTSTIIVPGMKLLIP